MLFGQHLACREQEDSVRVNSATRILQPGVGAAKARAKHLSDESRQRLVVVIQQKVVRHVGTDALAEVGEGSLQIVSLPVKVVHPSWI